MAERRYTKNGEWVTVHGDHWRVGLTASAVEDLGDVTFVELPTVGRTVSAGEAVCTIEAVKAAADFYTPVSGTIVEVNSPLTSHPALLNAHPEDEGWVFALAHVSATEVSALLDEAGWKSWESGH